MSENSAPAVSSQGFEYGVKHFYNPKSGFITEILFDTLQIPATEAHKLLNLGAIYVNNQRQLLNQHVHENCLFRVHTKPRRYPCTQDWRSTVVFENEDFVVIHKPSGIPSHPSVDNVLENSLSQLAAALKTELLITHRLDTLTSGLMVYAKNNAFVKSFNKQMQERTIEKKYVALAETTSVLPERLIHYMEPSPRAPKNVSEIFNENWVFCELEVVAQKRVADYTWVKINLLTGRTHQIRAQMSQMQAPILGDRLYGSTQDYRPGAIALRSCELEFNWQSRRLHFSLDEDFDI